MVQICSQCDTLARILGGRTDAGLRGTLYKGRESSAEFLWFFYNELAASREPGGHRRLHHGCFTLVICLDRAACMVCSLALITAASRQQEKCSIYGSSPGRRPREELF